MEKKKSKDYVKLRKDKLSSSGDSVDIPKKKPGISIVLKNKSVLMTTVLICFQGSSVVAIDDLFPLWAQTHPPQGLGFTPAEIGIAWSIGGTAMLIFQGLIYTPLIKRFSPLGGVRGGSLCFIPVFLAYPLLPHLAYSKPLMWVALGFVLAGRYVTGATTGTTLNLILNTVGGPEVQKHRGVVNGFAMSIRGIAMAFAPFTASSFFCLVSGKWFILSFQLLV